MEENKVKEKVELKEEKDSDKENVNILEQEESISTGEVTEKEISKRNKVKSKPQNSVIDNQVVSLVKNMQIYFGGQYYSFERDKKYKVSADLKKTLVDRGVVKPAY